MIRSMGKLHQQLPNFGVTDKTITQISGQSDIACDSILGVKKPPTSPIFAEHSSSTTHPCQYIAYFGPTIHPSSSNSSGSISDSFSFNGHWNGPSVPSEIPPSYVFPAMNLHYQSWEHHSPLFSTSNCRIGGSGQPSIPPVSQSSGTRTASAVASLFIPPYPGSNAQARDRVQALQAYYQHHHPSTIAHITDTHCFWLPKAEQP
ncbi:transcription factor family protein [Gossypium australe]|uniref:Transcription factor family protein n=1 Tax=Gossypium australe TaxID=47621 RepID=A0A5B6VXF1_9ROSI|nr:transcription factor family protein [Gossypium australe]